MTSGCMREHPPDRLKPRPYIRQCVLHAAILIVLQEAFARHGVRSAGLRKLGSCTHGRQDVSKKDLDS
jgi:hypothetical protein